VTVIDEATCALAERLGAALGEIPEVRLALLFGSRARGRPRPDSDIDIGVLLTTDAARSDRGRTIRGIIGRLGRAVPASLIDLVVLNDAPALLRHRVIRDGIVLLQRTPEDRVRFWMATLRDYQDGQIRRAWFTAQRVRKVKSGITDGGSRDLLEKARGAARLLGTSSRVP
jgi:predicted nucleotidyltransferase